MTTIKPGMNLEIVWQNEPDRIALKTIVYDVEERKIILSQTVPPSDAGKLGKQCMVTFVAKQRDANMLFRFQARVAALLADYELDSLQRVPALVLAMQTKPQANNLRTSFRIRPLMDSGISLLLQGIPVKIIDISVGGARVTTGGSPSLQAQELVKANLIIDNERLSSDCLVTRAWMADVNDIISKQTFATLQFLNPPARWESLLGKKILQMERQILAKQLL